MREYVRFSKHRWLHRLIGQLLDVLTTAMLPILCMVLLLTYVFRIATVQGTSMVPTLESSDRLLVCLLGGEPKCGDIVIINAKEAALFDENGTLYTVPGMEKSIVKRVIAVGGQKLSIDFESGVVYRDDEALNEPYTETLTDVPVLGGAFAYPITVPEGYVFVMGDNRSISKDSRYPDVGLVSVDEVDGKVLMRLYPFSSFGLLH